MTVDRNISVRCFPLDHPPMQMLEVGVPKNRAERMVRDTKVFRASQPSSRLSAPLRVERTDPPAANVGQVGRGPPPA